MAPYNYAGEEFLSVNLPDYETERMVLIVKLVLAFVVWLAVLPVMLVSQPTQSPKKEEKSETKTVVVTKNGTKKGGKKEKNGKSKKAKAASEPEPTPTKQEEPPVQEVSELVNIMCIFGFIITVCYMIVVSSPDNSYTTRGVFEAPLFTRDECNYVIDMAETVAQRNYEAAVAMEVDSSKNNVTTTRDYMMMEPVGWQKKRHSIYSTTDLNLVTDPFSKEDRQWIQEKLNARLAPTIERLYGVPQGSIRANDIFVIRYDGDRQASLTPHTDDGDVTFSALLSDDFTGGGTNYYDRHNAYYGKFQEPTKPYQPSPDEVFAHVLPEIGQMTLFRSPILHEGVQVKKGRRYLLIGFLNVDNVDPWSGDSTGLSWFASWLSLNWASVRFKMGYTSAIYTTSQKEENKPSDWMINDYEEEGSDWMSESSYIRGLFIQFHIHMTTLADLMNKHFFQSIIPADQTEAFLQKMDQAYARRRPRKLPSWFSGQQVELSIGGTFHSEWSTRSNNIEKFDEQEI